MARVTLQSRSVPFGLHRHLRAPGHEAVVFESRSQGTVWGHEVQPGDVLLAAGRAAYDEPVILSPKGRGRPMVGTRTQTGLQGPYGEACHATRWQVSGKLHSIWRRGATGWQRVDEPASAQLALFRQAA